MIPKLKDYQRVASNFIKNVNRCGLFLDVGLGKTLTTLTALVELGQEGRLYGHVLIIAPKRVAMNTWSDEIEKWSHTRGARYQILAGLPKKKREAIYDTIPDAPPTIYIINREMVPNLVDRFPAEQWQFLNVIIDEAQSFKNYASVGFKKLKSIAPYTHRMILLTGTPAPNGLMDIWSLIYLLDGGQRLGPNITAYRKAHFYPGRRTPQGYPYEWHLMEGHDEIIKNKIKDIVIGMEKEDYLDLPPITHNVIELQMTDKEYEVYRQLRREQILPLTDGGAIESANAAVLSGKLLQLSNGAIYADEEKSEVIELHKHKLHALEEIVDGSGGHPILCFYWFQHDRERLEKHFKEGVTFDGSNKMLKAWNNKEIPLMFVQPQSAGHGLNFQQGSHIMVFFSIPWSFELYGQAIGRLHRTGQEKQVIIHYLKMRGTVEDKIINRLIDKQLNHKDLMDAIRAEVDQI